MKCTHCGLRDATTEVVVRRNDHVEKMFLCAECAKEYRSEVGLGSFDMLSKLINGSPMGLLGNFGDLFSQHAPRTMTCPVCKTTGDDFLKSGFVGCPECYKTFEPLIVQTVKKLQQSDRHVGKTPYGAVDPATEEDRLKAELRAAYDSGNYERLGEISARLNKLTENKREDG